MAKFYIATRLNRAEKHQIVRDYLVSKGHEITYDWTLHGSQKNTSFERLQEIGDTQAKAIEEADFIVVLLPGGGGTHTELGMTLALKKPVLLHTERKEPFELGDEICAFYCCSNVQRVVCPIEELSNHLDQFLEGAWV